MHCTNFSLAHPAYTVVHAHLDCLSGVVLGRAKQHGVPVRIAHAHTTNQLHDFKYPIKDLYKRIIPRTATDLLACGEDAGALDVRQCAVFGAAGCH